MGSQIFREVTAAFHNSRYLGPDKVHQTAPHLYSAPLMAETLPSWGTGTLPWPFCQSAHAKSHVQQIWRKGTRWFSASPCTWNDLLDQRHLISLSLCPFFVRFIETVFIWTIFMDKLCTDIGCCVWKSFSSIKRHEPPVNSVYICLWQSSYSAFRLYPCLRFLSQPVHIKFLRAFLEV